MGRTKGARDRPDSNRGKKAKAMREIFAEAARLAGNQIALQRVRTAKEKKEPRPRTYEGKLEYLTYQALAEPKAFIGALGKTIEKEVSVKVEHRAVVSVRDFTGIRLEKLPPSVLAALEKEIGK